LQELEAEIDASTAEIEEVKDKIKKAKIAHRKILNSKDQYETALKIVARNLEGAQEDEDAGSIKEFSQQLAAAQEKLQAQKFSEHLKKSESKMQQLDKQLQDAGVHKQLHKEARRSLFVLSRGRQSSLIALVCGSVFSFCLCDYRSRNRRCCSSKASCTSRSNSWRSRSWHRLLSRTRYAHKLGPAHCPGRGALKDDEERTVLLTRCWFVLLVC